MAFVRASGALLRAKGAKFEDPHFPADATSLYARPERAGANSSTEQTFRKDQDPFLAGVVSGGVTLSYVTSNVLVCGSLSSRGGGWGVGG